MKRIVSLVLALSMVLGLCATAFASVTLTDVENTKYEAAVEALIELGVVTGYPNGEYQPTKEVNRAELAKMLVICMGLEENVENAKTQEIFSDDSLKDGELYAWARGYINTAASAGVIKGYPAGDFRPEKTVTYAEALTMMLRALGYGNVIEEEGIWPTNATSKAKELGLVKDVSFGNNNDGATRGDIAIMLWNMLRTPMWRIQSESQGTGMNKTYGSIMLNVIFADYVYGEGTLASYEINDGKVTLTVKDEELEEDKEFNGKVVGTVEDIDLLRLVDGMKVAYLYDTDEEEFLTFTTLENLLEGRVKTNKKGKLEVNGKECKYVKDYEGVEAEDSQYVVYYLDGNKIKGLVVLPEESYEIGADNAKTYKTLKKAKKEVGEDALVIIDGVWSTNEDLEEGDVITKVEVSGSDAYYVVARTTVKGEFESYTEDTDFDETRFYLEIDGEEYEANYSNFNVYEYDEDNEEYNEVTTDAMEEFEDKKGKYFGEDVELVLDYLGNVINLYYGEVKDTEEADYNFYVKTGKYAWDASSRDGRVYYYDIAGVDGEDTYVLTNELYEALGLKNYENASMYASFMKDNPAHEEDENKPEKILMTDEELAEALVDLVFAATLNDDGELERDEKELAKYFKLYTADGNGNEILDDDDENYFAKSLGLDYKITSSTKVFTIKAIIDEDKNGNDEVVGIEVEVSEGKDALEGVKYAKFAVAQEETAKNTYADKSKAVSYVFVGENAKSTDLNFGLVEKLTSRKGIDYVTISGTKYELDEDGETPAVGQLVSFRIDEDAAKVIDVVKTTDVDDKDSKGDGTSIMITKVEDGVVYLLKEFGGKASYDMDKESVKEIFEDITFVLGTASLDDEDKVEFDSDVEDLGEGLENVTFKKGDRLVANNGNDDNVTVIAIIRGLSEKDVIDEGALYQEPVAEKSAE